MVTYRVRPRTPDDVTKRTLHRLTGIKDVQAIEIIDGEDTDRSYTEISIMTNGPEPEEVRNLMRSIGAYSLESMKEVAVPTSPSS